MTQPTAPTAPANERPESVSRHELDFSTRLNQAPAFSMGAFHAALVVALAVREADHDLLPVPPEVRAMEVPLLAWAEQLAHLPKEVTPSS